MLKNGQYKEVSRTAELKKYLFTLEVKIVSDQNVAIIRGFIVDKLKEAKTKGTIEYAKWNVEELPSLPPTAGEV